MREILANLNVTTYAGRWRRMQVRLPFNTPKYRVAEFAIAKAKAELGYGSKWCLFNLRSWKTVRVNE